jgi:hypothetical protein
MMVANSKCRPLVEAREEFQGSNLWGVWHDSTLTESIDRQYVVYSYGHHFPIYIYTDRYNQWFGNTEKYSQSTMRHQAVARPRDVEIHMLSQASMVALAKVGYTEIVRRRLAGEVVT